MLNFVVQTNSFNQGMDFKRCKNNNEIPKLIVNVFFGGGGGDKNIHNSKQTSLTCIFQESAYLFTTRHVIIVIA